MKLLLILLRQRNASILYHPLALLCLHSTPISRAWRIFVEMRNSARKHEPIQRRYARNLSVYVL